MMPAVRTLCFLFFVVAICPVLSADEPAATLDPKDKLIVETVLRLKSFDLESSAKAKAAVLRYLQTQPGTDQYFELIERFQPVESVDDLVAYCLKHPTETGGVRGAELLFAMDGGKHLLQVIEQKNASAAAAAVTLIGHAAGNQTADLLIPLLISEHPTAVRTAAVIAVGRSVNGPKYILKLVTTKKLPADLNFVAANVLLSSTDESIKTEAAKHLQLPATADAKPLPPTAELVKRKGDAAAGALVFRKPGTCITCHKIKQEGKEVGPNLSEIGSKLSREAMYVSILDPSAAISHNFESYLVITEDGLSYTGLLISDTDDSVTLRNKDGIDKNFEKSGLDEFEKQKLSLMPQGLQKLMTVDQLVDLVEYLLTLRKPGA